MSCSGASCVQASMSMLTRSAIRVGAPLVVLYLVECARGFLALRHSLIVIVRTPQYWYL